MKQIKILKFFQIEVEAQLISLIVTILKIKTTYPKLKIQATWLEGMLTYINASNFWLMNSMMDKKKFLFLKDHKENLKKKLLNLLPNIASIETEGE